MACATWSCVVSCALLVVVVAYDTDSSPLNTVNIHCSHACEYITLQADQDKQIKQKHAWWQHV